MGNLRMNADQISYKGGNKPMSVEQAIKNAGNTGLAHTADIAPDFSTETAYNAGDQVYYNGSLYKFTANHEAGAWSTSDTQAVTVGGELSSLMSGLMSAAKAVYKDYHQIAASGNYAFTPTLEVNHTYIVAISSGNNGEWGYCGIMLKGWESYSPVLHDIYKGISISVAMVNVDDIQVTNNNASYSADSEIVVIDLGRGYQG